MAQAFRMNWAIERSAFTQPLEAIDSNVHLNRMLAVIRALLLPSQALPRRKASMSLFMSEPSATSVRTPAAGAAATPMSSTLRPARPCPSRYQINTRGADQTTLIVAVNYSPNQSQCYLQIPVEQLNGKSIHFQDLMSSHLYDRNGDDLRAHGLYLDLPAWGYHVFEMTEAR
jgi:hypothetical protein